MRYYIAPENDTSIELRRDAIIEGKWIILIFFVFHAQLIELSKREEDNIRTFVTLIILLQKTTPPLNKDEHNAGKVEHIEFVCFACSAD